MTRSSAASTASLSIVGRVAAPTRVLTIAVGAVASALISLAAGPAAAEDLMPAGQDVASHQRSRADVQAEAREAVQQQRRTTNDEATRFASPTAGSDARSREAVRAEGAAAARQRLSTIEQRYIGG